MLAIISEIIKCNSISLIVTDCLSFILLETTQVQHQEFLSIFFQDIKMNFVIEASGEANPLTISNLYQTLVSASSADQQKLKSSPKQLENWEKKPGYYSSLQVCFHSRLTV